MVMVLMYTWRRGSRLLFEKTRRQEMPFEIVWSQILEKKPPQSVPAPRYSSPAIHSAPTALLHSLKHYKVLHEKNVILTIETGGHAACDPPSACASNRSGRPSRG